MSQLRLGRRALIRNMALAAPLLSVGACGEEGVPPIIVPPGYDEAALLLEQYYAPELIPQLQVIGEHHASGRPDAEVEAMYEDAAQMLQADPDMETAFRTVDETILDDFRTLRIEDVAGWTLSRSETHLAVLSLVLS